jgi:CHAT domain-containing protein/Flp pilus assembly protein TadD
MGLYAVLLWGCMLFPKESPVSGIQDGYRQYLQSSIQASTLRSQGEYEKAVLALQRAIDCSRQINLRHNYRQCLVRMAILKWDLADIPGSLSLFEEALDAFRLAGDKKAEELCVKCTKLIRLYNQGKKDRDANLFNQSLNRFKQAISLGQDIGFLDFEVKCLRQQGLTYWEMARLDLFLESNIQGLEISKKLHHKVEEGRYLNNIGIAYHKQNEFSLAVEYLENALSMIRTTGDKPTEAECLSNLGILYSDLGNYSRAQSYLANALALDRKMGDCSSISTDLENVGTVLLRKGVDGQSTQDMIQGLRAFQECYSLQGPDAKDSHLGFTALNNIGVIFNEMRDHRSSRRYFEDALKTVESSMYISEKGHVLGNIATSHLYENNIEEALRYFLSAYELGARNSLENVVIESCFGLGKCYELHHEYSKALEYYQRSINALENVRGRISSDILTIEYSRNKFGAYQKVIGILAREYQEQPSSELLERIFNFMERAKARAFLDHFRGANIERADIHAQFLKERLQKLSRNISELSERLTASELQEGERALINMELEHEEDEFVRLSAETKTVRQDARKKMQDEICKMEDLQGRIRDGKTIFLEYFLGEDQSYVIFISSQSAKLFRLAGIADIEQSLRAYLKMISEGSIDESAGHGAAERIGRQLIPVLGSEEFKQARAIMVVPDGILHYLPFEALRIHDESGAKYLIEALAVSYCPSASALMALNRERNDRTWMKELLAIGGPQYSRGTIEPRGPRPAVEGSEVKLYKAQGFHFTPLPHSQREVQDIAKLFSKEEVQILIGEAASEDTVKKLSLEDFRIIHFACHGFLDEARPFRSALVLSLRDGQENDGFLQMREIYGLRTRADLVVLSACQTAQGILENAEGPMGLARSFFFAGARSVMASLWPINDQATVFFMHEFYRNLLSGFAADEALRLAKMKMLRTSWRHPFYWASFLLSGDTEIVHARR